MKKTSSLALSILLAMTAVSSTSFAFGFGKKKIAARLVIKTETHDYTPNPDGRLEEIGPSCVTDIASVNYDYHYFNSGDESFCEIKYYARSRDPKKPRNRDFRLWAGVYLLGNRSNFSLGPDFDFGIFNIFTGGISEIFIQSPLNAIKGDIERGVNSFRKDKRPAMHLIQPMGILLCDIEVARLTRRACPEATYLKGQYDNRVAQAYGAFLASMGVSPSVPLR